MQNNYSVKITVAENSELSDEVIACTYYPA